MENRAYSVLQVRSVNSEQRTFSGWATTPAVDRVGDNNDPMGLTFSAKTVLLWQHDHKLPVGWVKFGKPTLKGLPFDGEFPTVEEAGTLRDRVDEAWQSVKYGIVTAVSVGFRALKDGAERMKDGGIRFNQAEILELSLVSVPANSQAIITAIKSADRAALASAGLGVDSDTAADDSGQKKRGPVQLAMKATQRQPLNINVIPRK